jgi:ABC-type dipeptide/oligopeptide/nickel transport system permease component
MKQLIYIIILLMLAICFVSCRTQYIPVESVRTEYKTRDSIRYDSIYQRDSIYTLVKGDTVYQYRYKYLYRYLTASRTDTILKNDSIRVPYPVEKKLSRWQSIKMELGGWAFGIVIVFISVIIGRIVYRCKNK